MHPLNYLLSTQIISLLVHGNVFKVLVHEVRIGHISENNSVGTFSTEHCETAVRFVDSSTSVLFHGLVIDIA